jgi:hypothetical protein
LLRVCWPPWIAWYFPTASSRSSLVGGTVHHEVPLAADAELERPGAETRFCNDVVMGERPVGRTATA